MKRLFGSLILVFILINGVLISINNEFSHKNGLRVTFLDVGQGDAIFLETENGVQVLIDGGPDDSVLRELGNVMGFFDTYIDIVILTHGDKDHVGGLLSVLERYDVGTVITTGYESESVLAKAFGEKVAHKDVEEIKGERGHVLHFGSNTYLTFLYPDQSGVSRSGNNTSFVARLDHHDTSILLTGDIEEEVESYLLELDKEHQFLDTDVLKVAHHGSKTSSKKDFIEAVSPQYAIIQAECDNRYGHPAEDTLKILGAVVESIYTTCASRGEVLMLDTVRIEVR